MRERYRGWGLIIVCVLILLISCGGSSTSTESTAGGGSTAGAITLSADPPAGIPADGASSAAITATIRDGSGEAVAQGTAVTFSTTLGVFPNGAPTYAVSTLNDSGVVVASLRSVIAGEALVTVSSSGTSQGVPVGFVVASDVPSSLSLESSKTTVKSDNSDSATITAIVRAESSAVIEGVPVAFRATGGELLASSAQTDARGRAEVTFSAGTDRENHAVTITATVSGLEERSVDVAIVGTTVALSVNRTNIEIGAPAVHLLIRVRDAGGEQGVFNAPVVLTAASNPDGMVSLSKYTGVTDSNGELDVELSGTVSGTVTVTVQVLGAQASKDFVVGEVGFVFGITSPVDDSASLYVGDTLPIVVNAPDQTAVLFVTTVGTLTGAGGTGQVITVPVTGGTASAVLSSAVAGIATIWVMDADDPSTNDSLKVDISPPVSDSSQVALQATPTVIETNAGDVNTATLIATVRNADDQIIRGAPVVFSMERATGGGEFISPSIAYTNSQGQATATFTSGSLASDAAGVTVCAAVAEMPAIATSCVSIIIGGTAGSVVISQGSVIESVNNDTAYRLPMSVLVTDSAGSPVVGAAVSLSVWPSRCATGHWVEVKEDVCEPLYECVLINEDLNKNGRLDPGEDRNGDGSLTPPAAAAGEVPAQVITDENGAATFDLIYLKSSTAWIEDQVTATTVVNGTETRSAYTFWLPWLVDESCHLPSSPYSTKSVALVAVPATLIADGSSTSTVSAAVIDALSRTVADGEIVTFVVSSGTGTVDPASAVTVGGVAETTYTASSVAGTETVAAYVAGAECAQATVDITLTPATFPTALFDWADLGDEQHVLFTDASIPSAATGVPIVSWSWTFRRASGTLIRTSTAQNPGSVSLGSPGFYVAELRVADGLGAQDTVIEAVEVRSQTVPATAPMAGFKSDTTLPDQYVLFTDTSTAVSGTSIVSWYWTFMQNNGDLLPLLTSMQPNPIVSFGSADTYIASLRVTNNLGQSDTEVQVVVVP